MSAAVPDPAGPPAPPAVPPGWLKGQLHAHSDASGDSETPRADVLRWYAARGYDFVALTDHQVVGRPEDGVPIVLSAVEITQNLRTCTPPPEPGLSCLLHVNAIGVRGPAGLLPPPAAPGDTRVELFRAALAQADAMGGLAQINHPNFHYAADAALIAELGRGRTLLMEVANEAVDSNNAGDATHPSTTAMWDAVLGQGVRVLGTATDDAHHYAPGEGPFTGDRGFVVARAERSAASIVEALGRGDFYASTGALLAEVSPARVVAVDPAARLRAVAGGRVVAEGVGRIEVPEVEGFVRVEVVDGAGRRAWTQPSP